LVQGHTKFSCDRHFGTAKNSLRRADNIETFEEVMTIIKELSDKAKAVALRNPESGAILVKIFY